MNGKNSSIWFVGFQNDGQPSVRDLMEFSTNHALPTIYFQMSFFLLLRRLDPDVFFLNNAAHYFHT